MRRVAVTGVGVVSPGGGTRREFWELLVAGRTATRPISLFDASAYRSRVAAECDFDPVAAGLTPDERDRMDRYVQFGVVAAREAWADSGLGDADLGGRTRLGVSMGSAVGGTTRLEDEYVVVSDHGSRWLVDPTRATPHLYDALVPSSLAAAVGWDHDARGPATVVSTGCTSGLDAIGHGAQWIQEGAADVVVAGASESPISPISVACFDAIKATTARNDDPARASRPFDRGRDGFVIGEGAAVLVLEDLDHARRRGAAVYCEVAGFASRANAFHMTGLKPDGLDMAEAIGDAMAQARIDPSSLGYINAHGSGTKQNDRHETAAYKVSLGRRAYEVPVSSIKSMVGHSLGAIGAIELAACALAMEHGVVPPTANLDTPDPECDLDYVPNEAREARVDAALSVGSGFGGFQSAVVLARPEERML
jgi:beta-ketoacyl-acyl-carrier-protein synthase II